LRWYCSIQPSFSRCGQSVRIETMLERCAQRTRSRIWFSKGFEVRKLPSGAAEEWTITSSMDSTLGTGPPVAAGNSSV
jgi:hypothetical protein